MCPGLAFETPHAGVKNVWVGRIDIKICDAVLVVDVKSFGPRLAAVSRHEHAALIIWTKSMSERADVNDVRVLRIDGYCRNAFGIFETHVLPCLPAVSRFVNAIAERNAVANVRFACSDPDNIVITRSERDVADRERALSLEDWCPLYAAVRCLPQTAGCAC